MFISVSAMLAISAGRMRLTFALQVREVKGDDLTVNKVLVKVK